MMSCIRWFGARFHGLERRFSFKQKVAHPYRDETHVEYRY